ncbi:MAG TPA: ABC transporter ATP-binding protein [Planctomycetota bacterium]|nr:ABC transporter ATP-binding protein [Planctomycetota bacterium]
MTANVASAEPAIELRGLRKVYTKGKKATVAVDGLELLVQRGEVFGLLGPNGAGKTTTVEVCEGLTVPDAGLVRVLGRQWGNGVDQEIRERIGVCLQETRFHEKETVRETLALFASFYARGRSVDQVMALVSLQEKADARQSSLSGGQRQRLSVATALLGDPEILFLDEPTTGLDPQSRRQLWEVVRAFRAGGGTVVLTTHYMDEAHQLCDRIAIVDHGRIIALGTPAELIRSLGAEHFVDIDVESFEEKLTGDELRALPGVQACEMKTARASLTVDSVHRVLPAVLQLLEERGIRMVGLATRHATLEDVFVHLTGRHLREDSKP